MSPSPPLALYWYTIAVMLPVPPSAMTAYCVLSDRPTTFRGSIHVAVFGARLTFCISARVPSLKRYHFSKTVVAVVDCSAIGVVQPFGPPSVRVTFGRKLRLCPLDA